VLSYSLVEPLWLTFVHVVYLVGLTFVGVRITQRVVTRRLNK
jgi:hypothetical protein